MNSQLDYFGIKSSSVYLTQRFSTIADHIHCTGPHIAVVDQQLGTVISHLNLMRNWYVSTDEPYAIFCEDDIDFVSINHWNFTWDDFMANLPADWECIQLMRMVSPWGDHAVQELQLDLRWGRWWGSHSLMRRSYVKKLLERSVTGYNRYHLEIWANDCSLMPITENVLFVGAGTVYNFALLIETDRFRSTISSAGSVNNQMPSHVVILDQWRTHGANLNIVQALVPR
jgi:hypothetical protein